MKMQQPLTRRFGVRGNVVKKHCITKNYYEKNYFFIIIEEKYGFGSHPVIKNV
jgi:hypothetical protein